MCVIRAFRENLFRIGQSCIGTSFLSRRNFVRSLLTIFGNGSRSTSILYAGLNRMNSEGYVVETRLAVIFAL